MRINFLRRFRKKPSGQSFVELAIILPLLLLMFVGMVEIAFAMFVYLTALDQTREAARFASVRDFNEQIADDPALACTDNDLHYFLDTACFFTDPDLNPWIPFSETTDDVVITVFTIAGGHITERHPGSGYWSMNSDNWQKDCHGDVVRTGPFFSDGYIEDTFVSGAPGEKGLVLVEAYYCYNPVAHLPFISDYLDSIIQIHAYTFMPSPEAIPTPTPIVISP